MSRSGNSVFEESGLRFEFSDQWVVRKYDSHNYYRGLSSVGMKAVDFIGIFQEKAVLIEVKNYGQQSPLKAIEILNNPDSFIEHMLQKVEDTRVGIRAIHGYFMRNWWYRKLYPRLLRLPLRRWNRASWVFWAQLYHLVWEAEDLEVIFWFEFLERYEGVADNRYQESMEQIEDLLQNQLAGSGIQARINNSGTTPPAGLRVIG
ncbi:MAG: hypothetical protein GYB31_04415 [Bacteroidetes bacterium]|nr:hypothetical protein [Bacteroidota bacterium]